MKTTERMRLGGALLLGVAITAALAQAQSHRPIGTPVKPSAADTSRPRGPDLVRNLKLNFDNAKTPIYTVDAAETKATAREWGRLTLEYETGADWHDEVEVRFYAVTRDKSAGQYVMFTGKAVYTDVARGKHVATMFMTPNMIERYGAIERAAAEIYVKGQLAGDVAKPSGDQPWWRTAVNLKTMPDRLLDRGQTPFAFVSFDNYEDLKPRP